MELRSVKRKPAYNEEDQLKCILRSLNLYEDQMDLLEMRDLLNAISDSKASELSCTDNNDNDSLMREDELNVVRMGPMSTANVHNSTLLSDLELSSSDNTEGIESSAQFFDFRGPSTSAYATSLRNNNFVNNPTPPDSPTTQPLSLLVRADVHHPMDWTPPTLILDENDCDHSNYKSSPFRPERKRIFVLNSVQTLNQSDDLKEPLPKHLSTDPFAYDFERFRRMCCTQEENLDAEITDDDDDDDKSVETSLTS